MDLFDAPPASDAPRPLADRLRPRRLGDVVGQEHLLGPEGPLGAMLRAGALSSVVLWGPPGVGKTTVARLLAANPRRMIVFDSPPALAASPAAVLAMLVGQVMMVVRADRTPESELRAAVATALEGDVPRRVPLQISCKPNQHSRQAHEAVQDCHQLRHRSHGDFGGQYSANHCPHHQATQQYRVLGDQVAACRGHHGNRHAHDAEDIATPRGFLAAEPAKAQNEEHGRNQVGNRQ